MQEPGSSGHPEGLPAIVTAGLALGVQRLARAGDRKAIAGGGDAGCTTVICTDKQVL